MGETRIPAVLREMVRQRAAFLCEYCLAHEEDSASGFHVDHVIAEKHHGPTEDHNLSLCCPACNRAKGSDISTRINDKLVRLYNPRIDLWAEHFTLDGAHIKARSLMGAGTIRLLRMNDPARVQLRALLMAAGRFPSAAAQAKILPGRS